MERPKGTWDVYHLTEKDLDDLKRRIREELQASDTLKITKIDSEHLFVVKVVGGR